MRAIWLLVLVFVAFVVVILGIAADASLGRREIWEGRVTEISACNARTDWVHVTVPQRDEPFALNAARGALAVGDRAGVKCKVGYFNSCYWPSLVYDWEDN